MMVPLDRRTFTNPRNSDGKAVYHVWNERRMPIRGHSAKELSAMYCIGILNLVTRTVIHRIEVRRSESKAFERRKGHSLERAAVSV